MAGHQSILISGTEEELEAVCVHVLSKCCERPGKTPYSRLCPHLHTQWRHSACRKTLISIALYSPSEKRVFTTQINSTEGRVRASVLH